MPRIKAVLTMTGDGNDRLEAYIRHDANEEQIENILKDFMRKVSCYTKTGEKV